MKYLLLFLALVTMSCSTRTFHIVPAGFNGVIVEYYYNPVGVIPDSVFVESNGISCLDFKMNNISSGNLFIINDSLQSYNYEFGEVYIRSLGRNIEFIRYRVGNFDVNEGDHPERLSNAEDIYEQHCAGMMQ